MSPYYLESDEGRKLSRPHPNTQGRDGACPVTLPEKASRALGQSAFKGTVFFDSSKLLGLRRVAGLPFVQCAFGNVPSRVFLTLLTLGAAKAAEGCCHLSI